MPNAGIDPEILSRIESDLLSSQPVNKWSREVSRLAQRAARLQEKQGGDGPTTDVLQELLAACAALLQELSNAHDRGLKLAEARHAALDQLDDLFDRIPVACLQTDAESRIVGANRAAALLLNLSVKALQQRLLLHFMESREAFEDVLRLTAFERGPVKAALTIRPRERAPVEVHLSVCPPETGDGTYLFIIECEGSARRRRDAGSRAHRAPAP